MQPPKRWIVAIFVSAFALWLAGCVTPDQPMEDQPQTGSAPASATDVSSTQPEAPEPKLSIEQIQARRELELALERDVEEYFKRVSDRHVDSALEFVEPSKREAMQQGLWELLSNYSVEGHETLGIEVNHDDIPAATVRVKLTVFEKNSVVPQQQPIEQRWSRVDDRWLLTWEQ